MFTAERDDLTAEVTNAGYRILRGKGHTNYAIALATARIIEAILHDEHQVLPVSSLLDDRGGIKRRMPVRASRDRVQTTVVIAACSSYAPLSPAKGSKRSRSDASSGLRSGPSVPTTSSNSICPHSGDRKASSACAGLARRHPTSVASGSRAND
jgi:hypothetical protein